MKNMISCRNIGLQDCDFIAHGGSEFEVVRRMVKHLRTEHGLSIPCAEAIMKGEACSEKYRPQDSAVTMIINRLSEVMEIEVPNLSETPNPPFIGTIHMR
jgi:predicted small metal-binding protein